MQLGSALCRRSSPAGCAHQSRVIREGSCSGLHLGSPKLTGMCGDRAERRRHETAAEEGGGGLQTATHLISSTGMGLFASPANMSRVRFMHSVTSALIVMGAGASGAPGAMADCRASLSAEAAEAGIRSPRVAGLALTGGNKRRLKLLDQLNTMFASSKIGWLTLTQ